MKRDNFTKLILAFTLSVCCYAVSYSQEICGEFKIGEAQKKYNSGNFSDVFALLNPCLKDGFSTNEKINAYKILSMTYLAIDSTDHATESVRQMLLLNPVYEPDLDLSVSARFITIVNNFKMSIERVINVSSVSKKDENILEAPATVIAVTREEFKQRGYTDFEMVLHDLPGFNISRSNGLLYSNVYQRGYRSQNTDRTLFLIDGIEDNDLWSSNVYLSRQYPLSNLNRVEVVYGPASTMYGSNAFLGVYNIITKQPHEFIKTGKRIGGSASTGYGSYNTRYFDGTIAAQSENRQISFSLTGRIFRSNEPDLSSYSGYDYSARIFNKDNYKLLGLSGTTAVNAFTAKYGKSGTYFTSTADKVNVTDAGIQRAFELDNEVYSKLSYADKTRSYSIDAKLKVYDITFGFNHWKTSEGPGSWYNDTQILSQGQGTNWAPKHTFVYAKYEKKVNDKVFITNLMSFKDHVLDKNNRLVNYNKFRYSGTGFYTISNLMAGDKPRLDTTYLFQRSQQFRNELKVFWQPLPTIDIVAGFESRLSFLQGDYTTNATGNVEEEGRPLTDILGGNQLFMRDLAGYVQSTFQIRPKLKFAGGFRYDNNRVRNNLGYGGVFNPRLALVFTPGKTIFKAVYSEAFKDATNKEKYSVGKGKRDVANPALKPEKIKNIELNIGRKLMPQMHVNVTGYYSRFTNIIKESLADFATYGLVTNQFQNIGKQEVLGVEAMLSYHRGNLDMYANYTYTNSNIIDPLDTQGKPAKDANDKVIHKLVVGDIAPHQANVGANYIYKKILNVNLRANIVGSKPVGINTTSPKNTAKFDPYCLINSAITYNLPKNGISLQLTVNNVLNTLVYSPGVFDASGPYGSKLPQNLRSFNLILYYDL
jgi:outer membrane receptor for ferrienterochelin and colicin